MGQPGHNRNPALDIIDLYGLEVDRDIHIGYTGIRSEEKMYEQLCVEGEDYRQPVHEKAFLVTGKFNIVPTFLNEGQWGWLELSRFRDQRRAHSFRIGKSGHAGFSGGLLDPDHNLPEVALGLNPVSVDYARNVP